MYKIWVILVLCAAILGGYVMTITKDGTNASTNAFTLTSSAFKHEADIPAIYTCDNQDISPALTWTNPLAGTQSFVLICFDPDAPGKGWTHWIIYDIPSSINQLPQNVKVSTINAKLGINSWGKAAYGGPCPPQKKHRYYFTLYALDTEELSMQQTPDLPTVKQAMEGHILGQAELMGRYERQMNKGG